MKKINQKIILGASTIVLSITVIILVIILVTRNSPKGSIITRDQGDGFTFTSPILDCEETQENQSSTVPSKALFQKTQSLSDLYELSAFSVYYRDLNNGPWVGIHEKDTFAPASLMKTPLLIAFLKNVERNPKLLDTEIVATQEYFDLAIKQNFEVTTKIQKNETYTLKRVAELMIQESDNVAAIMLSKYIVQKDFDNLLESIGLTIEENGQDVDIRVKDFAGFFRVLYNASYLNREMSEFALSILAKSTFTDGIVAGVGEDVPVAHKYGERSVEQKQSSGTIIKERQFHDCGIVYHPKSPYILCIMTKGKDFEKQTNFIKEVSSFIYKEIE